MQKQKNGEKKKTKFALSDFLSFISWVQISDNIACECNIFYSWLSNHHRGDIQIESISVNITDQIYLCEMMKPASLCASRRLLCVNKAAHIKFESKLINCNTNEKSHGTKSYLAQRPVCLCLVFTVPQLCLA